MTAAPAAGATRRVQSAPGPAGAAIAVVQLRGDIDSALRSLRVPHVPVGRAALRDIGADTLLVARWREDVALLTPHGGAETMRQVLARLDAAGLPEDDSPDPLAAHPEASDEDEARMLAALSAAASPLAVDLLLDQTARWRTWDRVSPGEAEVDRVSAVLNRLLVPPLVVAVGPPNIGKSTLLNALAGRPVAIVADAPGVTRDHVGATIDLGGVVVRWADTPGVRPTDDPLESEAITAGLALALTADLLVLCADASTQFPRDDRFTHDPARVLRVGLRADLGMTASADIHTAAASGQGIDDLARTVRQRLVPDWAIAWPGPWRFDPALAR